jgi:dihydrolipoamide dehydrogenase
MADKYDLVVIGSGPGGYVAAIRAAQMGMKTACVERAEMGGICLNWGCIPTKALLHSASLYHEMQRAGDFGIHAENIEVDLTKMVKHSRSTANRLSKGIEYLFKKNKIDSYIGQGEIAEKGKVKVKDSDGKSQTLSTKNILIATGARPREIPGLEFDGKQIITSKEAMILEKKPDHLIVIGAGAIGVEFAYFYSTIGVKVTLIEMMDQILPIEDPEVAQTVQNSFKKQGIKVLTFTKVKKVDKSKNGVSVTVSTDDKTETIQGDVTLVAIGVAGNVENLGLENLGVKVDRGVIRVDKTTYETNVKGIYAIGDVIGPPWLAHVASQEGIHAVENMAGHQPQPIDYDFIPGCTYCQPQVASMGLTEKEAEKRGYDIKVGKFPFRPNGKSLAMGHTDGFVKLVFDAKYGELLGAHIVGSEATEMVAELGLAKTLETTADEIINTIHAHPTVSETIKEAAEAAFGKAIHI